MNLASSPFDKGVNEFIKSGFTPIVSEFVKPFRVKESPVQMECKVIEVKELGKQGGAGNLVICEIIKIHIDSKVLTTDNQIDVQKMDLISRMGDDWYCRANGEALFEVKKPISTIGIGYDAIPDRIKHSEILNGNNLGLLGSIVSIPIQEEISEFKKTVPQFNDLKEQHLYAKSLLEINKVKEAWMVLL